MVYSADDGEMLFGSRQLAEAAELLKVIGPEYESHLAQFAGAWGKLGVGDDFAENAVPQVEKEQEQVLATLVAMTAGVQGLLSMVTEQINIVKMPQMNALDAIDAHGRRGT